MYDHAGHGTLGGLCGLSVRLPSLRCAALILARASADIVRFLVVGLVEGFSAVASAAVSVPGASAAPSLFCQYAFIRSPTAFRAADDMPLA